MDRRTQGNAAEDRALAYLTDRGLTLVCRNFLCRMGELDLVMRDKQTLVIVEVRSRENRGYGTAAESITWSKRRRIVRTSNYLLATRAELRRLPVRFDVVTLDSAADIEEARIEWMRGAFDAGG